MLSRKKDAGKFFPEYTNNVVLDGPNVMTHAGTSNWATAMIPIPKMGVTKTPNHIFGIQVLVEIFDGNVYFGMVPFEEFVAEKAKIESGHRRTRAFGLQHCENSYWVNWTGYIYKGGHNLIAQMRHYVAHGYRIVMELDVAKQQLLFEVYKAGDNESTSMLSFLFLFSIIFLFQFV